MSLIVETMVLSAHPLALAHRMVLLLVARHVEEGRTECLVNRTSLAKSLGASVGQIGAALRAGEMLGLCRILPNGRISWQVNGTLLEDTTKKFTPVGSGIVSFKDAPSPNSPSGPSGSATPPRATTREVLAEFGRQWEASPLYQQRYLFTSGRDHKLAAQLASSLTLPELAERIRIYLTHPNPFYAQCAHAFPIFAAHVNEFIKRQSPPPETGRRVMDADSTREYLRRQGGQRRDHRDTDRT